MKNHKTLGIIFLVFAGLTILLFCLSGFSPIIKTISFALLSITLGIMAYFSFAQKKRNKEKQNHSDIDSMLGANDNGNLQTKEKISFWERNEIFGNGLVPYAIAFFAIVAFCVFIMMII